jgi:hypothetical protein
MKCTILKEILQPISSQEIMVPKGAEILCVHEQFEEICVWFRCDPNAPKEPRLIGIIGTGHPAPPEEESRYLGTASMHEGRSMFHVFVRRT